MAYNFLQGSYTPKNPQKYEYGEGKRIQPFHRSALELTAFKWCDHNPNVVSWSNEKVVIPYISPVDGRKHRYFMDLKITLRTSAETTKTILVEIKPLSQTKEPRRSGTPEAYLESCRTYAVNKAKWAAAKEYAKARGWGFILWTEEHLINGVQNDKEIQARMKEQREKKREERRVNNVVKRRAAVLSKVYLKQIANRQD